LDDIDQQLVLMIYTNCLNHWHKLILQILMTLPQIGSIIVIETQRRRPSATI